MRPDALPFGRLDVSGPSSAYIIRLASSGARMGLQVTDCPPALVHDTVCRQVGRTLAESNGHLRGCPENTEDMKKLHVSVQLE